METMNSAPSLDSLSLKYQGRKASRINSEQRRCAILEAALRIVVRDGVRGVRHRAVAKEANVPLSATTYYFKDISDLITDTFTLFVEMGANKINLFWQESDEKLRAALELLNDDKESREQFVDKMTDLAVDFVKEQLDNHREYLIAERSFQLECLRNGALRPIAFRHQRFVRDSLERFFKQLGSKEPRIDARLLIAVIMHVQYDAMVREQSVHTSDLRSVLRRHIELAVG
ncbi:MAG: TetR family transcriptional regulator [Endozoicomonas sp. (ex Botrylloides leachii)]|nr:TetR family transcriptional regulator [Endozoicomonas sp. (ex Botrylloides leachii)]